MTTWDPAQYERYKTYRDRPALDLLLQIPGDLDPREIWDLGCGTGEHAALLKRRHPRARVSGLDQSADMLAKARARTAEVTWIEGDVAAWAPDRPVDLIFTNAALQWVPDHARLFPRLVESLTPGGVLACQMPQSFDTVWHRTLRETAGEGPWADRLAEVRGVRPVAEPEAYYDWLAPLCDAVDVWTTTYLHVLTGDDPVVDWMLGTGLRPYLDRLAPGAETEAFLDAYRARLRPSFRPNAAGETLFPFPRLFLTARRRS